MSMFLDVAWGILSKISHTHNLFKQSFPVTTVSRHKKIFLYKTEYLLKHIHHGRSKPGHTEFLNDFYGFLLWVWCNIRSQYIIVAINCRSPIPSWKKCVCMCNRRYIRLKSVVGTETSIFCSGRFTL